MCEGIKSVGENRAGQSHTAPESLGVTQNWSAIAHPRASHGGLLGTRGASVARFWGGISGFGGESAGDFRAEKLAAMVPEKGLDGHTAERPF